MLEAAGFPSIVDAQTKSESMGVVTARLIFLAFLGLTGTIIYNALYLQEHDQHRVAAVPATTPMVRQVATQTIPVEPRPVSPALEAPGIESGGSGSRDNTVPPVSTDLPPVAPQTGESQLIVRAVQRELAARGYEVGGLDGQLSDQTRAAIASFQKKEGLAVTGLPSDDLLRQILLGDTIAPSAATGSVAAADNIATHAADYEIVMGVQQVLADLGYAPGPVDGAWGDNTENAVAAFQRDRNISETGQITPELLAELQRVTGRDFTKTAPHP